MSFAYNDGGGWINRSVGSNSSGGQIGMHLDANGDANPIFLPHLQHDPRWVRCKRPYVISGGELTLELELPTIVSQRRHHPPSHLSRLESELKGNSTKAEMTAVPYTDSVATGTAAPITSQTMSALSSTRMSRTSVGPTTP